MTVGPENPEIEDLFKPLPDELRRKIEQLDPTPPDEPSGLPAWARTLIASHSRLEFDPEKLFAPEAGLSEATDEGGVMIAFEGVCIEFLPGGQSQSFVATPKQQPGGDWMYPRLTDYWDTRVGAIEAASRRLNTLEAPQRDAALREIEAAVTEHVRVMSDESLVHAVAPFADDLYKAGSAIGWWGDDVHAYLKASAGTFSRLLSGRGFHIQYLVDNRWDDATRLLELFPEWYTAAGLVFCCPQVLIRHLARHDGITAEDEIAMQAPRYAAEARHVADQLVAKAQEEGRHFIHLDADWVESSFDKALERRGASGVITMFRNEAPEPGTKISVWPPQGFTYPSS
jgi:hypothetical protein